MIRGIDVSHYQGSVDWAGLKSRHGLSFGAAKCGEGVSFVDSRFEQNWARMKAAGLHRIAYWYAVPSSSSARTQAAKLVALADPQPGDALCLDLEKSSLSQGPTNAWMREFGDALHELAHGISTIAYLGGYASNGSGQHAANHFDHWWYPRYATTAPAHSWPLSFAPRLPAPNLTGFLPPLAPSIWQWTPNLAGMDANVSNLTVAQLFNMEESMPTADEIAAAVWAYDQNGTKDRAWAYQQQASNAATQARDNAPGYIAEIADAVIAKLPPAATGGLTKDDVRAVVVDVLTNGTGGASA